MNSVWWIVYDVGCIYCLRCSCSGEYVSFLHIGQTSMHIGVVCCVVCSLKYQGEWLVCALCCVVGVRYWCRCVMAVSVWYEVDSIEY